MQTTSRAGAEAEAPGQGFAASYSSLARSWSATTAVMALVAVVELASVVLVARLYGVGTVSDAYYLGFAVPAMVGNAVRSIGVQVLMPWFCLTTGASERDAHLHMSQMFFALLIPIAVLGLVAQRLAGALAPWLAGPSIDLAMLTDVLTFALPAMGASTLWAVLAAYLNSREAYTRAALGGLVSPACFVGATLLLYREPSAAGLGLARLLGTLGGVAWLAFWARPSLRRLRSVGTAYHWRQLLDLVLNSLLPSVALLGSRLGLAAERMMAGYLAVGSVAALSYSYRLIMALSGIFSQTLNTVIRSKSSHAHSVGAQQEIIMLLTRGIRLTLLVIAPVATYVVVIRVPIARLLFESDQFDAQGIATVAAMMGWFVAGLPLTSLVNLLLTYFYARGDTATASLHRLVILVVNLAFDLAAVRFFGVEGIAIAFALYSVVSALAAVWLVERQGTRLQVFRDVPFFARLAAGVLAAALASSVVFTAVAWMGPPGRLATAVAIGVSALAAGGGFLLIETLLGVKEITIGLQWLRGKAAGADTASSGLGGGRT